MGNPLRGDDGIGHWIGRQAEGWQLPYLEVRYLHQLHIDLLEELQQYETVIVADAALQDDPAALLEISVNNDGTSSSHHADAGTLKALYKQLYQQPLHWMACAIRATDFEMGAPISPTTLKNGEIALELLRQFLKQE